MSKRVALARSFVRRKLLRRWNDRPLAVLGPWLALSLLTAAALLLAVWVVASLSPADPTQLAIPGVNVDPTTSDYLHILYRNSLVLALHGMACVAGFMAGSSLPLSAANRSGLDRWVHEKAGKLAIGFVIAATLFSLSTQAYGIGGNAATIAAQLDMTCSAVKTMLHRVRTTLEECVQRRLAQERTV